MRVLYLHSRSKNYIITHTYTGKNILFPMLYPICFLILFLNINNFPTITLTYIGLEFTVVVIICDLVAFSFYFSYPVRSKLDLSLANWKNV